MKKVLSILLVAIMIVSVFGISFSAMAASNGFVRSGDYVYYYENGVKQYNRWVKWNGNLYYLNSYGEVVANQVYQIQSKKSGVWYKYFFNSKGVLQKNGFKKHVKKDDYGYTTTNYYYANKSGALLTGWQTIKGKKYYFDESSWEPAMFKGGICQINGYGFYFTNGGVLKTGWIKHVEKYDDGSTYTEFYCATKKGVLLQGWQKINGKLYYFNDSSYYPYMYRNDSYRINDKIYVFGKDGVRISKTGWVTLNYPRTSSTGKKWTHSVYYYLVKGVPKTGWQKIGGKTYFFNENYGNMYRNGACNAIKGNQIAKLYVFEKNGVLTSRRGFVKLTSFDGEDTYTYYVGKGGTAKTGWLKSNGYYYYFNKNYGEMATDVYPVYNENTGETNLYYFKKNGVWVKNQADWLKLKEKTYDGTYETNYYYFKDGKALTGWQYIGNSHRYFNTYSGKMYRDGIYYFNGYKYYFAKNGAVLEKSGWSKRDGHYLYADSNYSVYTGIRTVYNDNGTKNTYLFNDKGYWLNTKTGWRKDGSDAYYFVKGVARTGWAKINNKYYYFDAYGRMAKGVTTIYADNGSHKTYLFSSKGVWANTKTGWAKAYGETYYFVKGVAKVGWKTINGYAYCFNDYGEMYKNGTYYINGKEYTFRANGTLVR